MVRTGDPLDAIANDVQELKALVRLAFERLEALERRCGAPRTWSRATPCGHASAQEAANDDRAEPDVWLDATSAADRLGREIDTVRAACRNNGIGRKEGRIWLVNMTWARRHFRMT